MIWLGQQDFKAQSEFILKITIICLDVFKGWFNKIKKSTKYTCITKRKREKIIINLIFVIIFH